MKIQNFISTAVLLAALNSFGGAPPKSTPDLIAAGKISYGGKCATCHGEKGDGKGPSVEGLKGTPRNFIAPGWLDGTTPEALFGMISNGLPGSEMIPYNYLPEKERWALVYYIKSLAPKK